MEVKELKKIFSQQRSITLLRDYLGNYDNYTVEIAGLSGSSKSLAFSCTVDEGIHIIVLNTKEEAQYFCADLYNFTESEKVFFFPSSHTSTTSITTIKESSQRVQRSATINAINKYMCGEEGMSGYLIIVTYPAAVEEKILKSDDVKKNVLKISKGDHLSHEFIKETLLSYKFEKVDFVGEPGQFALRGGIIDLFSFSHNLPYRIDFFGNEIESIKTFDVNTQRSINEEKCIEIFPNIYDNDTFSALPKVGFFDYLSDCKYTLWGSDVYTYEGFKLPEECKKVIFKTLSSEKGKSGNERIDFNLLPQPSFNKNFDILSQDICKRTLDGYKVLISSNNPKQIERLRNIFSREGEKSEQKGVVFEELGISLFEGFIDNNIKICLYTDHQIFDRYHRVKIKREVERSERLTMNELSAFQIGDYIVHIDHGVGVFGGLVKTNLNGKIQEAVKLIYRDNDVIFVSIHGLHRIARYKSKDGTAPKIYKLGTGAWEKLKEQTKRKVKDIAEDLIKLYAKRRKAKGFAFSSDSYMQHELEASFIYEDTPDQTKTTQAVKEDMERSYPMDRLICGDVGFGKTEIAVRAAFKAVSDSKQVALLVPTTILALQHFKTFLSRLKDFPCKIDYLSRLRTTTEIREIVERIKEGKIDIIIGTHRLLNKEIEFKDLGLLIIDEEQKFGVAAKERLRQLKLSVDTLTLTATPIPRTLQFSLLGARDLSIINTPPPNRLPVQTEIIDFNEDIIRDAINFEVERGGQVFFVHNKVEDILAVEEIINRICPGIKTCVGHGQMESKQLESIVLDFMSGDYDVIVATSIVENGIDIPNANTIIINQAQNFGLSDLHQLRGRVGRSNIKAFCYLIVPQLISLSDDARRRLRAIEAFSDLGSGFNIAMQDLDIRGAGNLLGGEQSGFIADMGFETYQKILSEAFEEIKQKAEQEEESDVVKESSSEERRNLLSAVTEKRQYITDCSIDTDLELLIPDSYVAQTAEKIRLYKELDTITTDEALDKFKEALVDRFGTLPEQVEQLTFIVKLRQVAIKLGFEKIVLKNRIMLVYFISDQRSPYYMTQLFSNILGRLNSNPNMYSLKQQNKRLYLRISNVYSVEKAYKIISQFLN